MTDRNLSIKVALGAVNNLTQPFNAAQKSTAALGRQIKATRDNLRDLPKQAASFDKLAESSNKAAARIEKLRRASDAVKSLDNPTQKQIAAVQKWDSRLGKLQEKQTVEVRRLAELRASLYQHGVSVASNSTATEQITHRTAQYNRQLQLQEQRLKRVATARASYDRGQELRGKLQSGGMTALATGAVMAAPVALALRSYTGMEDAMKGVAKQVNGLRDDNGQRTAQFYEMQNAIKDAAELAPLPGGAADFAALVEGGARMGVATEGADWAQQKKELLDFANVSAKASKAFELPAGELAESLGKISGLYKIPTKDIEQLGDALNYLDDNAQSKGADIIDVLQRMGGVADRLNYKQAAALGSTFLSLGAQSEIAASAANAMVRELSIATITLGGLALAAAALLGPMLALRLGFSLLAGNGGLSIMLARLGNMLKWVATSPLRLLGSIGGTVFGALGAVISFLLSPIGLLVTALVGAGILIYKYWEPIKAFFSGFFTGLIEGLRPVREAFAPLAPIFDGIGSAIGRVWNWFTQLLSPVESSKASLEAATNAGKTFGEVVGAVISGLFWPVEQLAKGLGWLLEKLGAIPKAADAASGAVAAMNGPKAPVMYEWDPVLKKMVAAKSAWSWSPDKPGAGNSSAMANAAASPIASAPTAAPSIYGAVDRSKKKKGSGDGLASSSPVAAAADNVRDKLGDIVFKNVPDYLPLASPYLSAPAKAAAQPGLLARMQQSASDMLARTRDMIVPGNDFDALSLAGDIPQLARKPLSALRSSGPISYEGDRYDITIKLEGQQAASIDENKLVNMLYDKIATLQRQKESRRRSTFTYREQ
ncbi:phage tail tape measure protein [Yersinia enterocolitica]